MGGRGKYKHTEESVATLISAVKFLFLTWVVTSPTNKSPLFVPVVVIAYKITTQKIYYKLMNNVQSVTNQLYNYKTKF